MTREIAHAADSVKRETAQAGNPARLKFSDAKNCTVSNYNLKEANQNTQEVKMNAV